MNCETRQLTKAYSDRIVALAKKLAAKQSLDTEVSLCVKDYLVAKRYKNLLSYLADDLCCPGNVRNQVIEKLLLNYKK